MWVGTTYALAAFMIGRGLVDEGWSTARGAAAVTYERGLWFRTPEAYDAAGNFRATHVRPAAGDLGDRGSPRAARARAGGSLTARSASGPLDAIDPIVDERGEQRRSLTLEEVAGPIEDRERRAWEPLDEAQRVAVADDRVLAADDDEARAVERLADRVDVGRERVSLTDPLEGRIVGRCFGAAGPSSRRSPRPARR